MRSATRTTRWLCLLPVGLGIVLIVRLGLVDATPIVRRLRSRVVPGPLRIVVLRVVRIVEIARPNVRISKNKWLTHEGKQVHDDHMIVKISNSAEMPTNRGLVGRTVHGTRSHTHTRRADRPRSMDQIR